MRKVGLLLLLLVLPLPWPGHFAAAGSSSFAGGTAAGDFNGDGVDDLAVGVPGESLHGVSSAGAVNVIYGGSNGLGAPGNQLINQDSKGVPDAPEQDDDFGGAFAASDFNGDGYDDLAVSVVGEEIRGANDAGAVHVFPGSPTGLRPAAGKFITQHTTTNNSDEPEGGDDFGAFLAGGNFNGDRFGDLAIAATNEDVLATGDNAGAVEVLYGRSTGLAIAHGDFWTQASPGVQDSPEQGDKFGWALAAGDFGKGPQDDLAIGVEGEDNFSGALLVLYGRAGGLAAQGNQLWTQDSKGVAERAEQNDDFGYSLAAGSFGRSRWSDIAIGVPRETFRGLTAAGAVVVLYGTKNGLSSTGNRLFTQDTGGVPDVAEQDDQFGTSLAAADFGRTGYADLAVGTPFEDLKAAADAGAAFVLYGGSTGLAGFRAQRWTQDSRGIEDQAEQYDDFGFTLTAGDFGKGSSRDLAVGTHLEDLTASNDDTGVMHVLYGSIHGLRARGAQFWTQGSHGIKGAAETGDKFGFFGPCTAVG